MMTLINVIYFLIHFYFINTQIITFRSCPENLQVVNNFNPSSILGEWYEQYRYFPLLEHGEKCVTVNISPTEEGALNIQNKYYDTWNSDWITVNGTAKIFGPETEAKFLVEYSNKNESTPYWILGTDYNSFAVVWSCANERIFNFQNAWLLTRDKQPKKDVIKNAKNTLKKQKLSTKSLVKTNQSKCPKNDLKDTEKI